jgi:hypothetical protein
MLGFVSIRPFVNRKTSEVDRYLLWQRAPTAFFSKTFMACSNPRPTAPFQSKMQKAASRAIQSLILAGQARLEPLSCGFEADRLHECIEIGNDAVVGAIKLRGQAPQAKGAKVMTVRRLRNCH